MTIERDWDDHIFGTISFQFISKPAGINSLEGSRRNYPSRNTYLLKTNKKTSGWDTSLTCTSVPCAWPGGTLPVCPA